MNRRALQILTAVLAAIPVITGIIGMTGISDPLYISITLPRSAVLDSNLRFLSGVWLGLGVAMYWTIPDIDKKTVLFRAIWAVIFIGGIGRLISVLVVGLPPSPFVGFTVVEIVVAPIMVLWQAGLS